MHALFIGQTYIDVTFITDHMPTGDEKHVASAYAVSFGGNAVTAAFCCAKLGIVPDLIATVANDWLGRMFQDMSAEVRNFDPSAQGQFLVAVVHHAEGRQAGDRALPRRRAYPPLSASQSRRLPRAACRRSPAGCRDPLCKAVPRGRHPDVARRRRLAHQYPRAPRIHRRRHRRRAAVRADGPDAGENAGLSKEPRLPGRRRHHGRTRPALV